MKIHFKRRLIMLMPFGMAAFLVLLKSLSFDIFGFSQSYLTNLWAVIFYFSIFNPIVLNILTVFFLGVCADILLQMPFGISPLMYCSVYFIGYFNRRILINASFIFQWSVYILVSGGLFLTGLILLKLLYGTVPHLGYLSVEYVSLIIFYPLIATVCGHLNRMIGRYL